MERDKTQMNILCIIPARGGSKGLKNKNIIPFFGKPLIGHTIEAAFDSKLIDKIVVSTDDRKIAKVAHRHKAQVINRPKKYATDSAPIEHALRHVVRYLEERQGYIADIVIWLQANIPIRKKGQIDKVIRKLLCSDADSAVTVYPVDQFPHWMKLMDENGFITPLFPDTKEYRRQDVSKKLYLLDGSIIAIRKNVLMKTDNLRGSHVFMGKKVIGIMQSGKYKIEVDDKEDLDLAKFYLEYKGGDV